ncbi:MAG: GspE/PulE family protein [Gemmataceae bacterium]
MTLLNVDDVRIDPAVALKLPPGLALRRKVLPFALHDGCVHVACADPEDHSAFQSVEKFIGCPVRPEHAESASLLRALDRVYGDSPGSLDSRGRPRSVDLKNATELQLQDVVAIGDELLHAAVLRQASDIHLDPEPGALHVRFRVDGVLETYRKLPLNAAVTLISRFKVLAGLDIAEKRSPQDGGFKHRYGRTGQGLDIRVATLPTKHGERVTLRLLALQTEGLTLERLGMNAHDLAEFERALDLPHGMILLTGPTGSGKTTTLYAAIRKILSREPLNVITVEDPIEYEIPGAAQVEVDSADKVPFGRALRSVLRHDPDVVMIGEVRDAETADVAIKASLTGHLVFSTLHTNSAPSVITRLADMGVERYLVAATLRMAIAQRLVRRLCHRCRKPRPLTIHEASAIGRPEAEGRTVFDAGGCLYCGGHGNVGRVGLFEILPVTEEWSRFVVGGAEEPELLARMREKRIPRLIDDGIAKLFEGLISIRELMSAAAEW